MTSEELQKLRQMTPAEIARKYVQSVISGTITKQQYDWLLLQGKTPSNKEAVQVVKPDQKNYDEVVQTIVEEFGGREIKVSQKERLKLLLSDGLWHDTPEIQNAVYGKNHLGVARIAARIKDLKDEGCIIECKNVENKIWAYKMTL